MEGGGEPVGLDRAVTHLPPPAGRTGPTGECQQVYKSARCPSGASDSSAGTTMLHLLLLLGVALGGYVLLTQTLFKRSKCKGNAAMAGKTVIITGRGGRGGDSFRTMMAAHQ